MPFEHKHVIILGCICFILLCIGNFGVRRSNTDTKQKRHYSDHTRIHEHGKLPVNKINLTRKMNQNKASSLLDEEKRLYIIVIYLETALYSCALVYGILHLPLCWNPADRRKHNQVGPTTDMSSDNPQKEKVSFGSNEAMMMNFKTDEM